MGEKAPFDDHSETHGHCARHTAQLLATLPSHAFPDVDLLIVVRRRDQTLYDYLQSRLAGVRGVKVLLERRAGDRRHGAYYLRLMVVDQPGVIADVAAHMRDHAISVESLLQRGRSSRDAVPVVITTHETDEAAMVQALDAIAALPSVLEPPRMIRIETLLG